MSTEGQYKKKKSQVIVRDESCRQLGSSGAAPDVSVSPVGHFPPDPPIVREAVGGSEDVRRTSGTTRAQRLTMSQRSSLWVDLCQLFVSRRESHSRRQSGGAGLISETDNALDAAGLPIC